MRDDHTREWEGHSGVQGLNVVGEEIITIEGGRGAIKERTAQIKKRITQWLTTKVSMMGAADNKAGSRQWSREGCNNQPSMGAVKAYHLQYLQSRSLQRDNQPGQTKGKWKFWGGGGRLRGRDVLRRWAAESAQWEAKLQPAWVLRGGSTSRG
jgi:hypothetical protein